MIEIDLKSFVFLSLRYFSDWKEKEPENSCAILIQTSQTEHEF